MPVLDQAAIDLTTVIPTAEDARRLTEAVRQIAGEADALPVSCLMLSADVRYFIKGYLACKPGAAVKEIVTLGTSSVPSAGPKERSFAGALATRNVVAP